MRRCALEIQKLMPGVSINGKPRKIQYAVNYALLRGEEDSIKVSHFTHLEDGPPYRQRFLDNISKSDYYTVTCDHTRNILVEHGAPPARIHKIPYGCDERSAKKPVFGVVGRTKASGRKGEWMVKRLVEEGHNVAAWGRGWPTPHASDVWDDLPPFYRGIDYLLVTSTNEGGPVPVIDAIAAGVPVIAPDVGWCWEFPVIRYEKGSWEDLKRVVDQLSNPPTWGQWAEKHRSMFSEILQGSMLQVPK